MNMRIFLSTARFVLAIGAAASVLPAAAGPRDDEVASVTVYKQVSTREARYTYTVTNKGERPIMALSIGYDFYHGVSELVGVPPAPEQLTSPSSWTGHPITLEESDRYELRWENQGAPIMPGQTLSGFQVTVPAADDRFVQSHWTVIVDGPPVNASATLQAVAVPVDTIPPEVKVTLTPAKIWPPNGKMVAVHATVTATDNLDGAVPARLVSVTCNECNPADTDIMEVNVGGGSQDFKVRAARTGKRKDGRVYTVTYTATDRAGNTGTGTATVTIPHDQRK